MTIASEIQRIKSGIADAYTALEAKGATLPEELSVDNLADTIDNIPAGGGGGEDLSFLSAPFEGFKVNGVFPQTVDRTTYIAKGWQDLGVGNYSLSLNYMYTLLFDNSLPDVIYMKAASSFPSIYVPEGAVVSTVSGYTRVTHSINFSNCDKKYISFGSQTFTTSTLPICLLADDALSTKTWLEYALLERIERLYLNTYTSTTISSGEDNLLDLSGWTFSSFAKPPILGDNVTFSALWANNATVSISSTTNIYKYFPTSTRATIAEWLEAFDIDATTITLALSDTFLGDNWEIISRHNEIPYIIDFSGVSASSGTFYPLKYSRLTNARIKLPAWKIKFTDYSKRAEYTPSQDYSIFPMSLDSIRYIVNNAPTVSSKTFTIGSNAISGLNALDLSLITTLTNKGWTVS